MKTRKDSGRLVAELRHIIGKSQSQFATMIGVSIHTVISVENGRNRLTPKLARRIQIATGANLLKLSRGKILEVEGKEFTRKSFEEWRSEFGNDEESIMGRLAEIKFWIEVFFRAAARPGAGGNRDRFPAIYMSLIDWLYETNKAFKLEQEIETISEEMPHQVLHMAYGYEELCKYGGIYEQVANQLEMKPEDLLKKLEQHRRGLKQNEDVLLFADLEFKNAWLPENDGHLCGLAISKTKKLLSKPKYEFKITKIVMPK
jgi:transcriptional regulator with XRE-family HTH domain